LKETSFISISQFGIQSRGGCACAGPYAQRLLGMSQCEAKSFTKLLIEGDEEASCNHCDGLECSTDTPLVNSEFLKAGKK